MISVTIATSGHITPKLEEMFTFRNLHIPTDKIASYLATVIIGRVRKRYMQQRNADGTAWPMTRAAAKRLAGGYTWASGGAFAPGGKKTGGNILFSSGNLFHSIQMVPVATGEYSIRSDVPYARFYMDSPYEIIGTNEAELSTFIKAAMEKML